MQEEILKLKGYGELIASQGQYVVVALLILMVGLVAAKMLTKWLRRILKRSTLKPAMVSTVTNVFYVVLFVLTLATALAYGGVQPIVIRRILLAISLAAAGLIIVFRPLFPTLPFKVGNTIKTGALLGKVEAITILNTRLKTFDGKTVSVPNTKILNDYVINFHVTPTRRFELEVGIGYDQDILKAKQVLEAIMIEDPRVITKPRPVVYVVNLADSCVELSGKGWVNNLDYWRTKCDLLEKTKLRFDQEGITIAFPRRDVHLYYETAATASSEAAHGTSEKGASEPKARKGRAYSGRERHTKRHQATKN